MAHRKPLQRILSIFSPEIANKRLRVKW